MFLFLKNCAKKYFKKRIVVTFSGYFKQERSYTLSSIGTKKVGIPYG